MWCYRFVKGINWKNKYGLNYAPKTFKVNEILTKDLTLVFVGDIMELKERDVEFSLEIKQFVKDTDYIVGNFEGTITKEERIFMDQRHKEQILDALSDLFPPERTYLSMANNHAGDFGKNIFNESLSIIKTRGFNVFGTLDKPFIDIENKIRVVASSMWSNRPCDYISNFYDSSNYIDSSKMNIFYPHWGYELYLYPNKQLINVAKSSLQKFDAILGHHAHVPQPITLEPINGGKRLLAYSLGDFCYGDSEKANLYHYKYGIIMKVKIGLDSKGCYKVGEVKWKFVESDAISEDKFTVVLKDDIRRYDLN